MHSIKISLAFQGHICQNCDSCESDWGTGFARWRHSSLSSDSWYCSPFSSQMLAKLPKCFDTWCLSQNHYCTDCNCAHMWFFTIERFSAHTVLDNAAGNWEGGNGPFSEPDILIQSCSAVYMFGKMVLFLKVVKWQVFRPSLRSIYACASQATASKWKHMSTMER